MPSQVGTQARHADRPGHGNTWTTGAPPPSRGPSPSICTSSLSAPALGEMMCSSSEGNLDDRTYLPSYETHHGQGLCVVWGGDSRGEGGKDYSREALVPWTLPIHHRARKESKRGAGGDRGGRGARPPVVLASLRALRALRALSPAHSGAYRNPRPDQEVARSKPRGESSPVPPPMVSHILAPSLRYLGLGSTIPPLSPGGWSRRRKHTYNPK